MGPPAASSSLAEASARFPAPQSRVLHIGAVIPAPEGGRNWSGAPMTS